MTTRKNWHTEDGTFIGPWWLRWAFLAVSIGAPLAWFFITGSISVEGIMLWVLFLMAVNLLRAPG
ncbi:MAG TPA: hypothetical protein VKA94_07055 [Hyphomicrobiales bacterium]|nr:hypothetical protein [Hyphomicrobiales bacterium]